MANIFNSKQVLIFILIGAINSLVDLAVYSILLALNFSLGFAIIIASLVAMTISYILNSKFTFQTKTTSVTASLFFLVTITGIVVRYLVANILTKTFLDQLLVNTSNSLYHIKSPIHLLAISSNSLHNTIIWGISILVTMIYNFILYKKVVFR